MNLNAQIRTCFRISRLKNKISTIRPQPGMILNSFIIVSWYVKIAWKLVWRYGNGYLSLREAFTQELWEDYFNSLTLLPQDNAIKLQHVFFIKSEFVVVIFFGLCISNGLRQHVFIFSLSKSGSHSHTETNPCQQSLTDVFGLLLTIGEL